MTKQEDRHEPWSTRNQPRKRTFEYTVRDVAIREGWSEQKSAAILKDGIENGTRSSRRQAKTAKEMERDHAIGPNGETL